MGQQQAEQVPGQQTIEVSGRTVTPPDVVMLRWALTTLEGTADAIFDSYDEIRDQLVYLAYLQGERDRLGRIAAAIEARCAGAMNRTRIVDPSRGIVATREQRYTYTWEGRRLLFDLLVKDRVEQNGGEALAPHVEREVWDLVDYVLKFGGWTPKVTPLKEELDWDKEDIDAYRKSEKGARKVKVTLTETAAEGDGDAEKWAVSGPAGRSGDVDQAGDPAATDEHGEAGKALL